MEAGIKCPAGQCFRPGPIGKECVPVGWPPALALVPVVEVKGKIAAHALEAFGVYI